MIALIVILHVLVCVFLILVILLQAGKGSGMGAAFGGASQTVFGGRGAAPFLAKLTTATAIIFMVTSMTLAYFSSQRDDSGLKKKAQEQAAKLKVQKAAEGEPTPPEGEAAESPEAPAPPAPTPAAPSPAPKP